MIDSSSNQDNLTKVPPGVFWADHIKTLKDNPEARLTVAQDYQPLPAAFREAAIALRALIRERRKSKREYKDFLLGLYRTAATENFLLGTPYLEGIGPGFNIAADIPRDVWQQLELPYEEIGYEKLELLNKTDVKWLVEAWGEPSTHQIAQQFHKALWKDAVQKYRANLRKEEAKRELEWKELVGAQKPSKSKPQRNKSGCLGAVIVALAFIIFLGFVPSWF